MCGPMRRPTAAGRNRRHLPHVLKLTSIPPDALLPISISYDPELTGADRVTAPTGDFLDTFPGRNEFWSCRNGANDGWRKGIDYSRNCFQRWHWNRSRHDHWALSHPFSAPRGRSIVPIRNADRSCPADCPCPAEYPCPGDRRNYAV